MLKGINTDVSMDEQYLGVVDSLLLIDKDTPKNEIVRQALLFYSEQEVMEGLMKCYEYTKDSYYLTLLFFFPNDWLEEQVKSDNYLMRLVRYGYYYKKSLPLEKLSFFTDNVDKVVRKNIQLLTTYFLTKQPLILSDKVIDLGKTDEPKMLDLIHNEVIYDYELLSNHQQEILDYFQQFNEYKFQNLVSEGFVHNEWIFVRTAKGEKWLSLLAEVKELYGLEEPLLKVPYQLKESIVTFISLERQLVEYHYKKDIDLPEDVVENPSKIRTHLISLAKWHFKRQFRYVSFSFPHMDLEISARNLSSMTLGIFKLLPYVNKNVLKSILMFSQKLSHIREQYPTEYIQLELHNMNTYEALKVLDFNYFAKLHSELLYNKKQFEKSNDYETFKFSLLGKEFEYDAFSRYFYKILNRFDRKNNRYLLTEKAINTTCEQGYHYAMKVSLIMDYLFEKLPTENFLTFRTKISKMIKDNHPLSDIISLIEAEVEKDSLLHSTFYGSTIMQDDMDEELPF